MQTTALIKLDPYSKSNNFIKSRLVIPLISNKVKSLILDNKSKLTILIVLVIAIIKNKVIIACNNINSMENDDLISFNSVK